MHDFGTTEPFASDDAFAGLAAKVVPVVLHERGRFKGLRRIA
jgi:hypothetical protein